MNSKVLRARYSRAIVAARTGWALSAMRWGTDDCALAVANIDRAAAGIDTAEPWRGRYRTQIGARRALGKAGLAGALASAARRHGWKRIAMRAARTGDRALVPTPEGPALAIFWRGWWIGRRDFGFAALPRSAALRCYSIGD